MGKHLLPRSQGFGLKEDERHWKIAKGLFTFEPGVFPASLTLFLFVVFGFPLIAGLHLARDPNVRFWIEVDLSWFLYAVPVLLLCCHVAQLFQARPSFGVAAVSVTVPPAIFIIISTVILIKSSITANDLLGPDCSQGRKLRVEQSWNLAWNMNFQCESEHMQELWGRNKVIPVDDAHDLGPLSWCPAYQAAWNRMDYRNHFSTWDYLRILENEISCSGWCIPAKPLWTYGKTKDTCAVVAGEMLVSKVEPMAIRMLVFSSCTLVLATIGAIWAHKITSKPRRTGATR